MNVRVSAEDAGWTIREAAWGFEERVLWRGSDVARGALEHASERLQPLQRLIQTRLTWPLTDAFRARSARARSAVVAAAAATAIAAGAAGALTAADGEPASAPAAPVVASVPVPEASDGVLQGVTPTLPTGDAPVPPAPEVKPSAPPAQVAWEFAQAFVGYEVGRSSEKTAAAFAATATPPLAKALAGDPPRLPADRKVPRARVLNVVLADATKKQMTASVSLVRMRALSEVRLTLTKEGDGWRVAQVLG